MITTMDFRYLFESSPLMILVLSPDLRAIAATDLYLASTLTKRAEIMGRIVYDIFPDNPDDPNPAGVANLKASFDRVLQNKVPDAMGHLKYDIPRADGSFESRYWSTMNTPVLDGDGNVMHIINQVVDITDYIVLKQKGVEYEQMNQELREQAQHMESEIYQRAQQLQAANQKMSETNEALRMTQDELQQASEEMQAAHEELQAQQEELQTANEELQAQQETLQEMNSKLVLNNLKLEKTSLALSLKAGELERSNSFKTDFLSNMSHELRTPLNSMLILSKLLNNNVHKNLTDKQVEQAGIIHKAGNDLLTLINDILDLSKIEAGKMEVELQKTSVGEITESIEATFAPLALQKEIDFKIMIAADAYPIFNTDKFRLEQILKNLLSNAFKFTERGGAVTFGISKAPAGTRYNHEVLIQDDVSVLMFSVSDTGIGIAEDKQGDIFDAFRQADGSTSRKYGGTGLGLSISRQLAALLGGEIQLQSVVGEGSTFSVHLPVHYQRPEEQLPALEGKVRGAYGSIIKQNSIPMLPPENIRRVLRGKTVLITDDDERTVHALTMILELYGAKILVATNGFEAISVLAANPQTDLTLMDILMPELDGYETIRKIRTGTVQAHIPIIVLSARSINEDMDRALLAGVSDYLQKPIDIKYLLATMEIWLTPKAEIRL